MRIVEPIQIWRGCVIFFFFKCGQIFWGGVPLPPSPSPSLPTRGFWTFLFLFYFFWVGEKYKSNSTNRIRLKILRIYLWVKNEFSSTGLKIWSLVCTASERCAWQYCNPLDQEQWTASNPCLQKGEFTQSPAVGQWLSTSDVRDVVPRVSQIGGGGNPGIP